MKRLMAGICSATVLIVSGQVAAQTYSVTDIGTLGATGAGGLYTTGQAINNLGQIAGTSYTASGVSHAFLYSGGVMQDLGAPVGGLSRGFGINDAGQVVGYLQTSAGFTHAFIYGSGTMTDLGTFGGANSGGNAINNFGQVVGSYQPAGGGTHMFVYSGGTMTDPGKPDSSYHYTEGLGINDSGQIVARSSQAPSGFIAEQAFLYSGGAWQLLMPSSTFMNAPATGGINASGQIALNQVFGNAALYSGGVLTDLGSGTTVYGINSSAQLVGTFSVTGHALLFSNGSSQDISTLIDPGSPALGFVTLSTAYGINDSGWIVAWGRDSRDQLNHSYLLKPIAAGGSGDGVVPAGGGAVTDENSATPVPAQLIAPPGVLTAPTTVAVESATTPPPATVPLGLATTGSYFVTYTLSPTPSFPLAAPGLTVKLPLTSAKAPGTSLPLYYVDTVTSTLQPMVDSSNQPIFGTVDASGLSATFNGVTHFSTLVALVPGRACSVDADGDIDRDDIALITAARNTTAKGPFDPRDPDRNGVINVLDARVCALRCDRASCATY